MVRVLRDGVEIGRMTGTQMREALGASKNRFLSEVVNEYNSAEARSGSPVRAEVVVA
jgi:hypothetical protein